MKTYELSRVADWLNRGSAYRAELRERRRQLCFMALGALLAGVAVGAVIAILEAGGAR